MVQATLASTWGAPRWAATETLLRDLAWRLNLTIDLQVERGWVLERGRFRVTGDESAVRRFAASLQTAVARYNADD